MTVPAAALAAAHTVSHSEAAAVAVVRWLVLLGAGYFVVSLFIRRIGGKGGGSEKVIVGVGALMAAMVIGVLVATKR